MTGSQIDEATKRIMVDHVAGAIADLDPDQLNNREVIAYLAGIAETAAGLLKRKPDLKAHADLVMDLANRVFRASEEAEARGFRNAVALLRQRAEFHRTAGASATAVHFDVAADCLEHHPDHDDDPGALGSGRPRRIQRQRARGWRMPEGCVYVGRTSSRASLFGNPFQPGDRLTFPYSDVHGPVVLSKAHAVEVFRTYAQITSGYAIVVRDRLAGRDLCCWCRPDEPCHADVLLEIANGKDEESYD